MSLLNMARVRRETTPEEDTPADAPWTDGLVPLELYTVFGRESAWIRPDGERTSDWLNHGETLTLHGAMDLPFGGEPTVSPMPTGSEAPTERIASDVVLVVPPALPPNRHLRLHRRIEEVHLEMDSFGLVGRVHIRPGAQAGDYLLRGNRRFVPITRAELTYNGETPFRRSLPVVIVNVTHVTMMDRGAGAAEPEKVSAAPVIDGAARSSGIAEGTLISVRAVLEQLAELADQKLISNAEHRRKRAEILARL